MIIIFFSRSHLKDRILVQGQGGSRFQPAGILKYVEDLKRGPNAEIGLIDIFEIAYFNYFIWEDNNGPGILY
jgi:hypothetical protein